MNLTKETLKEMFNKQKDIQEEIEEKKKVGFFSAIKIAAKAKVTEQAIDKVGTAILVGMLCPGIIVESMFRGEANLCCNAISEVKRCYYDNL